MNVHLKKIKDDEYKNTDILYHMKKKLICYERTPKSSLNSLLVRSYKLFFWKTLSKGIPPPYAPRTTRMFSYKLGDHIAATSLSCLFPPRPA